MATEDLCLVCTDSLDYTGVGPCGHKEACSRCVARVRFVMEDSRCMLCKQDNPSVFFTRYMGDYTQSLPPQEFAKLQERTQAGELYCLPEVNGYFDDKEHYNTIKSLCSFTHPLVNGATFSSLGALKRRLLEQHKLHFCDLCIKGRKVFISEQVLYSKADLERHHRTGDDAGPLAESGFKGHPICRFCKKRFYDGDELYRHMESSHEHCFICRKQHPNRFVYYKDYAELDGHFQADHHPCPHPACLERKFVVFAEEQDLRRHFATEHGSEMNMSRAQRRQAMSLNIQLTYTSREEADAAAAAAAGMARPGVVIGGGHGLPRSGRGGRGGGGGMRHSHSEGAMAQALQASVDSSRAEEAARASAAAPHGPSSVTFSAEDFPTVSGQGSSGAAPLGTWVAAGSGPGGGSLNQEDFPALPTQSRHQRRRQRERDRAQHSSLASRLGAAGAPIRVVNRASAAAAPTPAEAAATAAAAAAGSSSSSSFRHSQSAGNLLTGGAGGGAVSSGAPSAAASDDESAGVGGFESDTAPAAAAPAAANHFPALPGAAAATTQAHPAWVPVRRSGRPPKPGQAGSSSNSSAAPAAPNSISDFPSLAATIPARSSSSSRGKGKAASSRSGGIKVLSSSSPSSSSNSSGAAAPPQPQLTVADAVAAAGGVSEQLKAANKALIERCKAALSEEGFRDFRERSAGFMQGGLSAGAYHKHVVALGLLQLVPQLAALCPDADKRAALVSAHKQYLQDSSTQDSMAGGRAGKGWVPPEAAMAALAEAESKGSWSCDRCTLINAPSSRSCEVCSAPRPKGDGAAVKAAAGSSSGSSARAGAAAAAAGSSWSSAAAPAAGSSSSSSSKASKPQQQQPAAAAAAPQQQEQPAAGQGWPGLPGGQKGKGGKQTATAAAVQQQEAAAGSSSSSAGAGSSSLPQQQSSAGGKKKKGQKQPLSELLATGKTHPQNAWSQQERLSTLVTPSGGRGSMGQWGKQGGAKLAKSINAFNDAWGGKK